MSEKEKKSIFKGVGTALITPFLNGEVDISAFRRLISEQTRAKIDALIVAGTTGEAPTLSDKERDALLFEALSLKTDAPVIMGCGSADTAHAVEYARRAEEMGADAILTVTPYYNKGTKRGVEEHFLKIAENVSVPLIVYNVPTRTGVDLSLESYDRLFSHPNVSGAKEASASVEKMAELCSIARGRAAVFTGNDALLLPSLSVGADGVISVASGVLPKNMKRICELFWGGNYEKAIKENERLIPLYKLLFKETSPAPVKYALSLLGLSDPSLRLPLTPPTDALKEELRDLLGAFQEG